MQVWRLCRAIHAEGAFSGEGARRFGGRWNTRGVPMVYCSSSLALAAIELFVHLDPSQAPGDLVSVAATLPEGEPARAITPQELPPDWWADLPATRQLGDAWIRSGASLALRVPSVPIHSEWNVLLNPLHPGMAELRAEMRGETRGEARAEARAETRGETRAETRIDAPQPFVFDARMFARGTK